MTHSLYILRDDEFDAPVYADQDSDSVDEEVWETITEVVNEALDHDGPKTGVVEVAEHQIGWKVVNRVGISFVVVLDEEQDTSDINEFLKELSSHYMGEVDDVRFPDTEGLEDVLVDVIAPWDE